MAIQTLADTGIDIPFKFDGAVYNVGAIDCVCGGIGDEFTIAYNSGSLNVSFASGSQAIVCGNFFHINSSEVLTLPANSNGFICAEIDISQTVGHTGKLVFLTEAEIRNDNINGNGTIHDLRLYRATTNSSGVTAVTDLRRIVNDSPVMDIEEQLKNKADKTNYYTKSEADALLNNKADKTNYYTKTETNTLLNNKADKTNYYTKSETNTLLNNKADKTSLGTQVTYSLSGTTLTITTK